MRRLVVLLAVVLAGAAPQAAAQAGARVEVTVDSASRDPRVRVHNLMEQSRWREAIDDAFRISLSWRVELWNRKTFWSTSERSFAFQVVIRREPLLGQYFITYFIPGKVPISYPFNSFDEFVLQLERAIQIRNMAPATQGDWYYVADLRVSALDEEQFAEMQRFIGSGGQRGGGDAVSNFLLRVFGLPSQDLPSGRSPQFRVP